MRLFRTLFLATAFLVCGTELALSAPGDVVVTREGKATEAYKPATFPHWVHAIRYRCYVCHPAPFKMVKFKLEKGTLKQDRPPFVKPSAENKAGKKTGDDGKQAEKKADTATKKKPGAQDRMHGEQACGMCHNGKTAFNVEFKLCARCHAE